MTPEPSARPCPVCASVEQRPYLVKEDLTLVRCVVCSMVYASPAPAEFASGEYYGAQGTGYYLSAAKLESDYAPVRFRRELSLFRRHCQRGRVLDVGCSSGAFLFQLKTQFPDDYELLGTDVSGAPLDYAESRGVPVRRGDFRQMNFDPDHFDAVTFWAVLEHLSEPRQFLEQAARWIREGGLCFVLVPNMRSLAARLLGHRYRYIYPQHLNYFTRSTLARLVSEWFEIVETRTTHFNPAVIWQDWRSGGAAVPNEQRAQLLRQTTRLKESRCLAPVQALYGWTEKALGAAGLADNLAMVLRKRGTPVTVRAAG